MSEPESRKLFVGGLSLDTSEATLHSHFATFGEISEAMVVCNHVTKKSRGFGFVTFRDGRTAGVVMSQSHKIDEKTVDVKAPNPR